MLRLLKFGVKLELQRSSCGCRRADKVWMMIMMMMMMLTNMMMMMMGAGELTRCEESFWEPTHHLLSTSPNILQGASLVTRAASSVKVFWSDFWTWKKLLLFSVTSGGLAAFERGCTEVSDESKYTCQQVEQGGHNLHYCNCHGSGCNEDWTTAGEV